MVVAILQGRVTTGNPVLQLPPGKESSGFQLPAILTFPQRRGRGSVRFPSPQKWSAKRLGHPGASQTAPSFWLPPAPGSARQLSWQSATPLHRHSVCAVSRSSNSIVFNCVPRWEAGGRS